MKAQEKRKLSVTTAKYLVMLAAAVLIMTGLSAKEARAASYVINNVTLPLQESGFRAGDYTGRGVCWDFAQHIYYQIWGRFFSPYAGTDDDVLRDYPRGELRRITAANAKLFISAAPVGSVIRLQTVTVGSDSIQSSSRHSLIVLAKSDSGCVLYHAYAAYSTVEYLSWNDFENKFRRNIDYGYFKYIKCPGAKALEYKTAEADTVTELTVTARLYGTAELSEVKR